MFFHNLKYSFKILLKNKPLIFWTIMFPIILLALFNMAFSNILETEKFDAIDIAIVKNEDFESNQTYQMVFKQLSDESNEEHVFNTQYVTEDEAKELLQNDKIVGYLKLEGDTPKVTFIKNGGNQTIFKYIVEEISQKTNMMENITEHEIEREMKNGNTNIDPNEIAIKAYILAGQNDVKLKNVSNKNLNYMVIEFYTLVAMACLYSGAFGMVAVNQSLANMSSQGKRVSVSPIQKIKLIFSSVCAAFIVQLAGITLLFLITSLVFKIDYGTNKALVTLLAMVGSLAGLSLGVAIASVFKASENTKVGILIGFTMLECFFAGMTGVKLKYIIDKNIPILNKLNPANMITDGFYSLYYYDACPRYYINVISLVIFALILLTISIISLRRQKYDSI